jgi:Spy/CpxP family protein refolding chaperone
MKSIILAAILALAATPLAFAPTEAASLTITTGDSGHSYYRDYDSDWHDNGWHRGWYRMHHRGWQHGMRLRRDVQECDVTTTRHWRHGRMVVVRTRECY